MPFRSLSPLHVAEWNRHKASLLPFKGLGEKIAILELNVLHFNPLDAAACAYIQNLLAKISKGAKDALARSNGLPQEDKAFLEKIPPACGVLAEWAQQTHLHQTAERAREAEAQARHEMPPPGRIPSIA